MRIMQMMSIFNFIKYWLEYVVGGKQPIIATI